MSQKKRFPLILVAIIIILGIIAVPSLIYKYSNKAQYYNNSFTILNGTVSDFTYVLQYDKYSSHQDFIDNLTSSGYDMAIMDMYFDPSTSNNWTTSDIQQIKSSGVIPLCYISIGEAKDNLPYWNSSWTNSSGSLTINAPSWLGPENSDKPGVYPVQFWNSSWQSIVYSYLDKIISLKFDGIYLDGVEVYNYWEQKGYSNANQLMINYVENISQYVKSEVNSSYIVCLQNAEELAQNNGYLNAVDGIGRENIFYNGDTVQNSQEINNTLGNLALFMNAGKFVLDIEYPTTTDNIKDAFEQSYNAGFLTYVTTKDLDTITFITNYEPKYT